MVSLAWNAPQNINFRCAHMEPMPINHGATPGLGHLHRGASNPQIAYDKEFAKTFISTAERDPKSAHKFIEIARIEVFRANPTSSRISYFSGMIRHFTNTIEKDTPNNRFLSYRFRIEYETIEI
jgi:hypothetical protein